MKTSTFRNKGKDEMFDIGKGISNCSSNLVVYLIQCKSCSKQYLGSTSTPFRTRFNNNKSGTRKVSIKKFMPINVMSITNNFTVTLTLRDTTRWRTGRLISLIGLNYRPHGLDAFIPNRLNERFVGICVL